MYFHIYSGAAVVVLVIRAQQFHYFSFSQLFEKR